MKKRIFSILLSIGLTLTLLPGTVLATGPDAGPAEEIIAASQAPVMIETAEEPLQTPDEAEEVELLQVPEETPGEVTPEKETPGEEITTLQAAAQGETVSQAIQTDALGADAPTAITSVDITVNVPAAGTTVGNAKNAVSVPSGANYIAACAGYYEDEPLSPGEAVDIGQSDYLIGYYGDIEFGDDIGSALPDEATFAAGQTYYMDIRLTANDGYMFRQAEPGTAINVSGAKLIGENTLSITNTASEDSMRSYGSFRVSFTVPAVFTPVQINLCTSRSKGGVLTLKTTDSFYDDAWMTNVAVESGSQVTMVAEPNEGYEFAGYYEGILSGKDYGYVINYDPDKLISSNKNYTFTATKDTNVYALFNEEEALPSTLTLHWSSIDQDDLIEPVVIENIASDASTSVYEAIEDALDKDPRDGELVHIDGYMQSHYLTPKPMSNYSSNDALERKDVYYDWITEDMDVYVCMYKVVTDDVEIAIEAPKDSAKTTTPRSDDFTRVPWIWEEQTNKPAFSIPFGKKYRLEIDDPDIPYTDLDDGWGDPYCNWVEPADFLTPYSKPFIGPFVAGDTYYAEVELVADFGYGFAYDDYEKGYYTGSVTVDGGEFEGTSEGAGAYASYLTLAVSVTAEHDPAEPVAENRVEPTCGTPGSYEEVVYCKGCGKELSRETKVIPATSEHTWDAGVVTTEPTCTTKGAKTVTCTVCGATTTEEIPALGHTPGSPVKENEIAPTCTKTGSYDEVVYCTVCGEEISREKKDLPALGHDWGEWTQTTAPTCTEAGEETRTCERCKESETRSVDPLGHTWDAGVVTTEPTCTTAGAKTFTCTVCGATTTEEIPALGHTPGNPVKENEVAPTCTKAGSYDEVVYCTVCGEEVSREKKDLPALGHAWGEWAQTTAPTCTEAGEETRTCERCGEAETREVAALGHAWGEWIVDKEATEEADGLRHRECSRCSEKEEEVIPKIEVSYDIVEGDSAIWYTGSNDSLTFTFKRSVNDEKTFELFQRIEIDGKEVAPASYEAKAGSVIITLKPEYIKTLAVGKHTLTAFFEDGKKADATFTIAEKKADVVPGGDTAKKGTGVKTGDNANAVLYMGLGIAALLIITVTLILLKRRSRHEQ